MNIYQPTISGSLLITGSIVLTGNMSASLGYTGSLLGSSSYATTSSYVSSNVGEWVQLGGTTFSPADATTYYFGLFPSLAPATSTAGREFMFISAGTVTNIIFTYENTATGTNENVTLYLRNNTTATDNLIGTITMDAGVNATAAFIFSTSISIANTTDKYSFKIVTPTWVTNPTGVYTNARIFNRF